MTYFPEQSFKVLQKQEVIKVGRRPVNICHNYSLVMRSLLLPFELLLSVPGSDPSQQNNTTQDPAVAFFFGSSLSTPRPPSVWLQMKWFGSFSSSTSQTQGDATVLPSFPTRYRRWSVGANLPQWREAGSFQSGVKFEPLLLPVICHQTPSWLDTQHSGYIVTSPTLNFLRWSLVSSYS